MFTALLSFLNFFIKKKLLFDFFKGNNIFFQNKVENKEEIRLSLTKKENNENKKNYYQTGL